MSDNEPTEALIGDLCDVINDNMQDIIEQSPGEKIGYLFLPPPRRTRL